MALRTARYDAGTDTATAAPPARRTAYDLTRALFTLLGAAGAGFLVWIAAHVVGHATDTRWWISMGILAGGGLALVLSQLFGGWTKWGFPRVSAPVFLLAFVPAAVCVGWILLTTQPNGGWEHGRFTHWSSSIGILGLVKTLGRYAPVLAFGLGSVFGYTFDTTGPRRHVTGTPRRGTVSDRRAADEPTTAERTAVGTRGTTTSYDGDRENELATTRRGTPVAPQTDTRTDGDTTD